jgi:hypothetical protein
MSPVMLPGGPDPESILVVEAEDHAMISAFSDVLK